MYRLPFHLLVPLLLATACFEKDEDDDDDDDGDDTGSSSWDDGGDGGDGGGAPNADNDGDGQTNREEAEAGTDPDNAYSRSYTGGYNVNGCDTEPEPTEPSGPNNDYTNTWAEGDVMPNIQWTDQYGETVDLYSFCGNHVMISIGAMWCGPCIDLASRAQGIQDEYADQGFQMIEVLIEDESSNPPEQDDLQRWADNNGLETIPVLDDVDGSNYGIWPFVEQDWGIPTTVHLGPGMEVLSVDEYIEDPGQWL